MRGTLKPPSPKSTVASNQRRTFVREQPLTWGWRLWCRQLCWTTQKYLQRNGQTGGHHSHSTWREVDRQADITATQNPGRRNSTLQLTERPEKHKQEETQQQDIWVTKTQQQVGIHSGPCVTGQGQPSPARLLSPESLLKRSRVKGMETAGNCRGRCPQPSQQRRRRAARRCHTTRGQRLDQPLEETPGRSEDDETRKAAPRREAPSVPAEQSAGREQS